MNTLVIEFQKLSTNAQTPTQAYPGDAGWDLYATNKIYKPDYIEYKTGLAVAIPPGYVGLLFPRSSVSNYEMLLANSVGVVDSGYRGEISFRFKSIALGGATAIYYEIGDKIGQLVVMAVPQVSLVETYKSLATTDRGVGGYGSSGK